MLICILTCVHYELGSFVRDGKTRACSICFGAHGHFRCLSDMVPTPLRLIYQKLIWIEQWKILGSMRWQLKSIVLLNRIPCRPRSTAWWKGEVFDTVLADPPSFSHSSNGTMARTDRFKAVGDCMSSSFETRRDIDYCNQQRKNATPRSFSKAILDASRKEKRRLRLLLNYVPGTDFPAMLHFPEARYLKVLGNGGFVNSAKVGRKNTWVESVLSGPSTQS